MSINVFVEGNRTCGKRKGRVTLSDLELIKRSEKERRRRLRLEQVFIYFPITDDRVLKHKSYFIILKKGTTTVQGNIHSFVGARS